MTSLRTRWLVPAALVFLVSCTDQDSERAAASLRLTDVASYWSVKGSDVEKNNYIRPVVRFRIANEFDEMVSYTQAMAVFRRESFPDEYWGSDYLYEVSPGEILPGEKSDVLTLRCDANFVSKDPPELMFENEKWEQVVVEVFVRVGPSAWKSVGKRDVEKRLGAPGLEKFLNPEDPIVLPDPGATGDEPTFGEPEPR